MTGGAPLLSPLADVEGAVSLWTRASGAIARGVHGDEFTRAFRRVCLAATHDAVDRAARSNALVPPEELDEQEIVAWLEEVFKEEGTSKALAQAVLVPETTIDQALREYLVEAWQRFVSVSFAVPLTSVISEFPEAFREALRRESLDPDSPLATFLGLVELLTLSERARDAINKLEASSQAAGMAGQAPVSPEAGSAATTSLPAQSDLLLRFVCGRDRVIARVNARYEPPFSAELEKAFERLNIEKKAQGGIGYYAGQRFRMIKPPVVAAKGIQLELTPLNYGFVALMKDELTDPATKAKIGNLLSEVRLPKRLQTNDRRFQDSHDLLGTEVCLLTRDGHTLLRRRGENVLTGRHRWDVSVSGHPTDQDLFNGGLDLARTISREASDEIGFLNADERRIQFLGLHRNRESGDVDMCAIWPIEDTARDLRSRVSARVRARASQGGITAFPTTERARERYVWNTENIVVEFSGPMIRRALAANGLSLDDLLPESLVCLELALRATNCPPLGIELD
jgi:hypothetical protein